MRSELVSGAVANISNRYLLASLASRATCVLHRPNGRIPDTVNDVFRLLRRMHPTPDVLHWPERTAPAGDRRRFLRTG